MRMRRKALAMEASMPTRLKEDSEYVFWWNWTVKPFLNLFNDQEWFSPAWWPGKSVEVMFVTVSGLMSTIWMSVRIKTKYRRLRH